MTEDQKLGPDAQRASIRRWCGSHGVEIASWHVDQGVSGAAPLERRAGLLSALDALASESAGLLVVAKRDRLARDVVEAAMIERLAQKCGARVVSANGGNQDTAEGELMRGIMDLFAQYERALIRRRTTAALAVKRRKGEKTGGEAPYGFRVAADGRTLERDETEQSAIESARRLRDEGQSYRAICDALSDLGFLPRTRGRWWPMTVRRMLARDPSV